MMSRGGDGIQKIQGKTGVENAKRKSEEGVLLIVAAVMMVRMTGAELFPGRT